jgi:Flp pilus assembly protein TadD
VLRTRSVVLALCALVAVSTTTPAGQRADVTGLLREAAEHLRAGHLDAAEPLLRRALRTAPDNADAHNLLGVVLDQHGKPDEAEAEYREALRLSPKAVSPRANLGALLTRSGRHEEAIVALEEVVRVAPGHPQATVNLAAAHFMLGEALRTNGLIAASKDCYEHAVQYDPSRSVYHIRLGGVFLVLKHFERALETFQRAAERFPDVVELDYFTALAARVAGQSALASTALRRAMTRQPENADVLALLGEILLDSGDMDEAEKLLRRAVQLNDRHFNAHSGLGNLLVTTRRYADAVPVLERAALLNPREPAVHYKLFLALLRLGRDTDAERELALYKQLMEAEKETP